MALEGTSGRPSPQMVSSCGISSSGSHLPPSGATAGSKRSRPSIAVLVVVAALDRLVVKQAHAGIARRNEDVELVLRHVAVLLELLDAATADRLTQEQV